MQQGLKMAWPQGGMERLFSSPYRACSCLWGGGEGGPGGGAATGQSVMVDGQPRRSGLWENKPWACRHGPPPAWGWAGWHGTRALQGRRLAPAGRPMMRPKNSQRCVSKNGGAGAPDGHLVHGRQLQVGADGAGVHHGQADLHSGRAIIPSSVEAGSETRCPALAALLAHRAAVSHRVHRQA